jgi:hypothetical protein
MNNVVHPQIAWLEAKNFLYADVLITTTLAQKPLPSRDREGADAQLLSTLCLITRARYKGAYRAAGQPMPAAAR